MKNWTSYWKENEVNESLIIPGIKIDELLVGLDKPSSNYKKIIASFFNTYEDYIDLENMRTFKVNDLTGDILQNNRVMLRVLILQSDEIQTIVRDNVVAFCVSEFYGNLPNSVNIFGIDLKPISFVNKEDLEFTFENMLTVNEISQIITKISGYEYKGDKDGYYIWSMKL